ncbi:S16 family serine protease [Thioflavicoccus mobilis]|uniref:S16 family serine protease n=1 Tax=Thioflavicoccus mobilis TaxID=80679 RepID=UPI00068831B8|nr:S16 family serine protease [Thioflavicoccus mobilis]
MPASTPLSLSASLVFEQIYGGVDGDSASSAELYALLLALAELPIRQSLAVIGAVNQRGEIQAIDGVNEKIEGFYDTCAARVQVTGRGGLIPAANVKHLMLRADVREAAAAGRFAVYPVATVDEGIELLTGTPAGVRGADGCWPLPSRSAGRARPAWSSSCKRATPSSSNRSVPSPSPSSATWPWIPG